MYASNCANLALNLGFDGLFVEADAAKAEHARSFYARHPDTRERPPVVINAFITRENVNDLVRGAGFEGEVDLLSIDVDGNDYWLWEALDSVTPRFVVIEGHTELGLEDYVMPYEPGFDWRRAPSGTSSERPRPRSIDWQDSSDTVSWARTCTASTSASRGTTSARRRCPDRARRALRARVVPSGRSSGGACSFGKGQRTLTTPARRRSGDAGRLPMSR